MHILICIKNLKGPLFTCLSFFQNNGKQFGKKLVQVGIRTLTSYQQEQADKYRVIIIQCKGFELRKMPKLKGPLYVSIDLDILGPAFAARVSHHGPGRLSTGQLLVIIQSINTTIVETDIVEYNPKKGYQWCYRNSNQ
ncbi:arginase family protein [Maribacter sp. CXY002]|uniref:arginase family protein n=1 Tax=Maribacter luteocoastalis TaxID=3407671 RepID=UPI003B68109B